LSSYSSLFKIELFIDLILVNFSTMASRLKIVYCNSFFIDSLSVLLFFFDFFAKLQFMLFRLNDLPLLKNVLENKERLLS